MSWLKFTIKEKKQKLGSLRKKKKTNKKIATNEFDSAKGLKDLFVLLLIDSTENIISETGTFSWGKEKC